MKHDVAPEQSEFSLRSEELAAQQTALRGRLIALAAIVPLTTVLTPWPAPVYVYGLFIIFAILGWGAWYINRLSWGRPWMQYAFVTADFVLLTFTLLYPNPLLPFDYPPQFVLRFGSFIYFFVLLAGLAYVYQPKLVLWGGVSAAVSWSVGVFWMTTLSGTVFQQSRELGVEAALRDLANPRFIDLGVRAQEVIVILIASGLLALAVKRSRMVAERQANLAREKSNLARYFPKKTAQMLAGRSNPFSTPREHRCAVLFADLVAFTTWSENHKPGQTIELLREVHGLLANSIFRHQGTLDKFIGDGIMATFGTPEPTQNDASNAMAAMIDMTESFEAWKSAGGNTLGENLNLSIGVHYGPVVIGNIGSEERLEFAVLGDTVNVASRLESATRDIGCRCLASQDLIDAAKRENPTYLSNLLTKFKPHSPIPLRGRSGEIQIAILP